MAGRHSGRFKGGVVESGYWVLACSLYLHLNPVAVGALGWSKPEKRAESRGFRRPEAAVVKRRLEKLRGYPWSSFRSYAGYVSAPDWLTTGEVLTRVGGQKDSRQQAEEKVARGLAESFWSGLRWGLVLGGEAFAWRRGDPGLALALSVARRCTGLTLRSLGEAAGGMDYNAVGMAIKRLEQRVAKEPALRPTLEAVINEMQ